MTNYSGTGIDLPMTASGDLNGVQYRFVQPAQTAKKVEQATGGSSPAPFGVLQNDPRDGEAAAVRVYGTTYVYASTACGAISYRDWLTSGSDGQAVLTGTGAGSAIHAMAMTALASGSGVLIEAFIFTNPMSGCQTVIDNTP